MIVYCISGLGADHRVFANLRLEAALRHISWVRPLTDESIESYCKRLAEQIDASRPFVLLGVSFGGIIAQFMAKLVPAEGVIIVSSYADSAQLPAGKTLSSLLIPFIRLLPASFMVPPAGLMAWLFGIQDAEQRLVFFRILKDTDPYFLRWALRSVLKLKELPGLPHLVHLHGTADKVIPCPKAPDIIKVKGGGHFMIFSRAVEISELINSCISNRTTDSTD